MNAKLHCDGEINKPHRDFPVESDMSTIRPNEIKCYHNRGLSKAFGALRKKF